MGVWTRRHAALEGRLFRFGVTGKNGELGALSPPPFTRLVMLSFHLDPFPAPRAAAMWVDVWSGGSSWPRSRVSLCPCSEEHVEETREGGRGRTSGAVQHLPGLVRSLRTSQPCQNSLPLVCTSAAHPSSSCCK